MSSVQTVDDYIAALPEEVREIAAQVRAVLRETAPEAQECISYRMPAYRLKKILVYFAIWKEHIGIYPPITGDAKRVKAVAPYAGPQGNLQIPLDQPIPFALLRRIVKHRLRQITEKK